MLAIVWMFLAILATVRGAGWRPWILIGVVMLAAGGYGFILAYSGVPSWRADSLLSTAGLVLEIGLVIGTAYFAITAREKSSDLPPTQFRELGEYRGD